MAELGLPLGTLRLPLEDIYLNIGNESPEGVFCCLPQLNSHRFRIPEASHKTPRGCGFLSIWVASGHMLLLERMLLLLEIEGLERIIGVFRIGGRWPPGCSSKDIPQALSKVHMGQTGVFCLGCEPAKKRLEP